MMAFNVWLVLWPPRTKVHCFVDATGDETARAGNAQMNRQSF
jgi:hypothetical protein